MAQPTLPPLPLVDSHLDLAENVTLFGRDLTLPLAELRAADTRATNQATVSLPELERGGVAVVFATVTPGFTPDDTRGNPDLAHTIYYTAEQAEAQALRQIALYNTWEAQGRVRLIQSVDDLEHHLQLWAGDGKPGLVLLMEGADPIVRVGDLAEWWRRGLRMIGLTFGDTRYGTGVSGGRALFRHGGLTPEGVALLNAMAAQGFIWDISHLAEEGVWQGLDRRFPRVCASHANARALIPTDRHLTDEVIRAVAERDGVIGVVLYNGFLEPRWRQDRTIPVTVEEHVRRHLAYLANLGGWQHVGIGSDLDGGFGLEASPREIESVADLYRIGAVVPAAARDAVLSTNWLDFLRRSLPRSA
ncbi:MAG: membrane dipeptidase [Anaerolineae bacterium]